MLRLLRTAFVLIALNAACIALVLVSRLSESAWACLRFQADDHTSQGLLDTQHGVYFIEQPLTSIKFQSTITWLPVNSGLSHYYEYTAAGIHHLGIVGYERAFNLTDNGPATLTYNSLYGISPDDKYIILKSYVADSSTQTLTARERTTLVPIVSVVIQGNATAKNVFEGFASQGVPDWSSSNMQFAFTSYAPPALTLTVMSMDSATSQSVKLSTNAIISRILWSPAESAIAVLSKGINGQLTSNNTYTNLDIVRLINGQWQLTHSYDVVHDTSDSLAWALGDAAWSLDGQTLNVVTSSITEGNTQTRLLSFDLNQPKPRTIAALDANTRPLMLTSSWLCVLDAAASLYRLIPLTAAQPTVTLSSRCNDPYISPDQRSLLLSRPTPQYPDADWAGLTVTPFKLTPLAALLNVSDNLVWSKDGQWIIFRSPGTQTASGQHIGQIGLINTTTWQWSLVDRLADFNLSPSLSPDSSRFTLWDASTYNLLLLDTANHLLAELAIPTPYPFALNVGWTPDSNKLLVTSITAADQPIITIFDRDGHRLSSFNQPPQWELWLGGSLRSSWSRCEPSFKFRA